MPVWPRRDPVSRSRRAARRRAACRAAVALAWAVWACVAVAQEAVARLEGVVGVGPVPVGGLPDDARRRREAGGELPAGALAARGRAPAWVATVLFNLEAEGVAARGFTLARLTQRTASAAANVELLRPTMAALEAALPSAAEAERRHYGETLAAFARSEAVLEDLRRLLAFLESRSYLAWSDVAPGRLLLAGETLRVGDGAEATLRYGTGAVVRVGAGSTVEVAPPRVERAAWADVATRLWRGIVDFYVPPGGEHAVGTAGAVVRVRGTEFQVRHEEGVTHVAVTSGAVEVLEDGAAEPVVLAGGEARAFGAVSARDAREGAEAPAGDAGARPTVAADAVPALDGWLEVAEGGVRVLVPEAWRRAPDLTLWWVGDDPADPWGVLAFADLPSFDAERDLGAAVVARFPDAVGGRAATRYELRYQEEGFVVFARYLAVDEPLPDGRRPVFTGFWRDTHPFEPEVARFLSSVRFEDGATGIAAGGGPAVPAPAGETAGGGLRGAADMEAWAGVWKVDANGFAGTLVVLPGDGGWVATLELAWGVEALHDVAFDGGELRFVRPLGADDQVYVGRLDATVDPARIAGTFDQGGTGSYPWFATRIGDATVIGADAEPVAIDEAAVVAGGWRIVANGQPGTLTLEPAAGGWIGVLNRVDAPEGLVDVAVDGAEVRFVRPLGAYTQAYQGLLERDDAWWRLEGTFDQGGAGSYVWWAVRPVDAARTLAGTWRVDLSGSGGAMTLEPAVDGWRATLLIDGADPEALTAVAFDGVELTFTRPAGDLTQVYWAVLDRDGAHLWFHGRFGYGAIEGYRWRADREAAPSD